MRRGWAIGVEAHEEFGVVWDEVGGGSEQGLEEGPAFLTIAREQRSDTSEQGAFGPIGERPDEIGEDLALGLEPDDRVRVEGLTDGHLVRQRLRDGPMLADAFVQVLELRAQCGPMGLEASVVASQAWVWAFSSRARSRFSAASSFARLLRCGLGTGRWGSAASVA